MGDDLHDAGSCCQTCEQWAGREAEPVERAPIDAAPGTRFRVIVTGREHRELIAKQPRLVIGRGATCDLQLRDGALSRKQAELVFEDDAVFIRDLASSCGTFVDGRKIGRAPVRLGMGARIQFGNHAIVVEEALVRRGRRGPRTRRSSCGGTRRGLRRPRSRDG
jgi:pSer/pThr/pTyr-binding forkhead associated (FHA) protein